MKTFKQFFNEQKLSSIAILPGGFKPPHKGHFEALNYLLKNVDQGIVYIGGNVRDGITPNMSEKIWNIYKKYIPKPVSVVIAQGSPVSSLYTYIDSNKDKLSKILVGAGEEDLQRYNYLNKNRDKYSMVEVVPIPPQFGRISGTVTRKKILDKDPDAVDFFVPEQLSLEDKESIKDILYK